MPQAGMREAGEIAGDLIAEISWLPALGYMLGKALGASTWRRAWRALRLAAAVLFAPGR